MDQNQTSALQAALERAAATMRNSGSSGSGLFPPMDFGGPGMFNPTPMASQGQPGMQPTPNAQVANRFGGMQPPSQPQQAMAYAPPDPNRGNMTVPVPPPSSAPAPAVNAGPPTPQPGMGFFAHNAAMMRDPVTGSLIDPSGAARAQQQQAQAQLPQAGSGSFGASHGIIPGVMNLIGAGTGAPGTNANGSIQGAYGPTSVGGAPLQQAQQQDQGGLIQKMLGYLGSKQS